MRARRSRSQYALRWERGRPARNPDHARKKPTPLSPVHGGGWEGGMLKNQRKDTYKLRGQSSELPPSFRFPPLREGNRAARPLGSPCEQGEP